MTRAKAKYPRLRYAPPLTQAQFSTLRNAPYDHPAFIGEPHRGAALVLKRAGLLEEDPQTRGWFRCTEAGTHVVRRWWNAGWR